MTLMYMYVRRQGPDSFVEVCYLLGQIGPNLPQGKMTLPLSVITAFPLAVSVEIEHRTIHHEI